MKLGEFLRAINSSKQPILDEPEDFGAEKTYLPFIVNRTLSYFPDTLMAANAMNMYPNLDHKAQFDFLRIDTPKRQRFSAWDKLEKVPDVQALQEYFGYNYHKAEAALEVLTLDQVTEIKRRLATRSGAES